MNQLIEKALHAAEQNMTDVVRGWANTRSDLVFGEIVHDMKTDGLKLVKAARKELEAAALAAPAAQPGAGAQNPLVAFLVSSNTGASCKAIAARYAGVPPAHGSYSYPLDSDDFGRCHRLLQLVPAIDIAVMRGAFPVWDRLVDAWPALTAAYERKDEQAFQAIIRPLTHA